MFYANGDKGKASKMSAPKTAELVWEQNCGQDQAGIRQIWIYHFVIDSCFVTN